MINPQVTALNKSATLKITALTKKLIAEGKDVVNFAAGEPDFDTPEFIKDQARQALASGLTKYTPSCGIPALREAIAAKLRTENNIPAQAQNVIVTSGAKYAIYVALLTLVQSGDEVIIPSPYWVSYPEMVQLCGAKPKFLKGLKEDDFKITPASLAKAITAKTKVLILNYPNNPTGLTFSRKELEEIYQVVKDRDIFVISDEIYEVLSYDSLEHTSFASLADAAKKTITINGFSKTFSMTGWRLGYLSAPDEVSEQASKIIDHTTSCACSISQNAAFSAFKDQQWPKKVQAIFQERRDIIWKGLKECPELDPIKPQGTFYLFCDISSTGLNASDFATQLLEKHLVSCIPADSFGISGFVRMSFATSNQQISKGIERIKVFLTELGK
ncbi:MAG: pyridoxal phosphate-dependent aminotransferase [Candidatus Omnitrophica bacterium]|nr:pyridoxal phosphate-dependent aminotransferase [Candidatus Omnitrophota bacterium]MBU2474182.1 pyridoxal phosphate-dependent aminotransferase [Candidatus Omnitrophota bacterium]